MDQGLEGIAGEVIRAGDEGYEQASTVYAGPGTPEAVVRARSTDDIAAAIAHAAARGLPLSVRSGGHSGVGFGTNDGGVVIDLSALNDIEVLDRHAGTVRVGAGATWGEVAEALAEHGLGITSGDTRSVGVGGLALGGGLGWMVRQHGLTIDNMLAAQVVTADGRVLRASADEHPDLFWALRGGGGNFGVVTEFEFHAREVGEVHAGVVTYPFENVTGVLTGFRDAMREAPDELNATVVLMPGFGDFPAGIMVLLCYGGDDEAAATAAIDPLTTLGTVVSKDIARKPYAEVLEDAHPPQGVKMVVKNTLAPEFSDEVIAAVDAAYGSKQGVLFVRSLGRAVSQVPADATAFAHRDSEALIVSGVMVPMDATDEMIEAAARPWEPIGAAGSGSYANFLGTATAEDVARVYPPKTYARLAEIKKAYDPGNLFRLNHNIQPAS